MWSAESVWVIMLAKIFAHHSILVICVINGCEQRQKTASLSILIAHVVS